ncbi:MAG: IS3 family transposase [Verrucomicrobiales bacterium]|nr:IS3 family transposase [Verrucomicrobiales bacterium]
MAKKAGWRAAHRAIQAQPKLKVVAVCRIVGMTPQNYYARRHQRRRQQVDVDLMLGLVRAERREQPRLGTRKVYHLIKPELKKAGVKIGRDRVFKELKKAELLVARKQSQWPKTTHYNENLPVFKNLVKDRKVTRRNQVWVADITYIRTEESFLYLALVTDKWSRKIVGFHLSESLEVEVVIKALNLGLKSLKPSEKPIHHSDRGCQYASHTFVQRIREAGLRMSMTEMDHCAENSMAERVNGILKQEYWLDATFPDSSRAKQACAEAIRLYNMRRPHKNLAMKTPEQVHQA